MNKFLALICTHNPKIQHITEQLNSINESSNEIEIVVYDFNSSDFFLNFLKNRKIKFFHFKEANGPKLSFIKAFKHVQANFTFNYVYVVDQDDIWLKRKHEIVKNYISIDENVDLIFHDVRILLDYGKETKLDESYYFKKHRNPLIELTEYHLQSANPIIGHTLCVSSNLLMEFNRYEYSFFFPMHDWALAYFAISNEYKLAYIDMQLSHYRIHQNNVLGLNESNKMSYRYFKTKRDYLNKIASLVLILNNKNKLKSILSSLFRIKSSILLKKRLIFELLLLLKLLTKIKKC